MKEIKVEEELGPLTLQQFFEIFFEGDVFLRQWHERRGNTGRLNIPVFCCVTNESFLACQHSSSFPLPPDIHFGQWISEGKGDRKQRLVRFTPPPAAHPMLKRFTSMSPTYPSALPLSVDKVASLFTRACPTGTKFKEVQQFSITPKGYLLLSSNARS